MATTSSRARRTIWVVVAVAALPAAVLGMLALLQFGNPQWHKYIYLFQANVSPGYPFGDIDPPPRYTGTWTQWYPDGGKKRQCSYRAGVLHGQDVAWYADGSKASLDTFRDGKHDGRSEVWHENGRKAADGFFTQGKRQGKWTVWNKDGSIRSIQHYEYGLLVGEGEADADP